MNGRKYCKHNQNTRAIRLFSFFFSCIWNKVNSKRYCFERQFPNIASQVVYTHTVGVHSLTESNTADSFSSALAFCRTGGHAWRGVRASSWQQHLRRAIRAKICGSSISSHPVIHSCYRVRDNIKYLNWISSHFFYQNTFLETNPPLALGVTYEITCTISTQAAFKPLFFIYLHTFISLIFLEFITRFLFTLYFVFIYLLQPHLTTVLNYLQIFLLSRFTMEKF